jgi:hypothetical protein
MYFALRSELLDLSADRLCGLRLSLNTPVISVGELPVGPARAAVAIHEEIDGRPNIAVGVRSLRTQAAVIFSLEGDLNEHSSLAVGIDAALSFGESMGFLFDEDEFDSGPAEEVRPRALGLWLDLMVPALGPSKALGQIPAEPAPAPAPSVPEDSFEIEGLDDDSEVLLLEKLADPKGKLADAFADGSGEFGSMPLELEGEEEKPEGDSLLSDLDDLDGIGAAPEVSGEDAVPLSKFRHAASGESPPPSADQVRPGLATAPSAARGTPLGRLKLVKRPKGSSQEAPRPSLIRRLLSSF